MKIRGYHPACLALPPPTDEEVDTLAASIKATGQLDPITVMGGLILDGRTRVLACQKLGVTPRYEEVPHLTIAAAAAFVAGRHIARRTLSASQKAALAERLAATASISKEKAAEVFGVSLGLVKLVRKLRNQAPELADAVQAGTLTASAANAKLQAEAPPTPAMPKVGPFKSPRALLEGIITINDVVANATHRSVALRQLAVEARRLLQEDP